MLQYLLLVCIILAQSSQDFFIKRFNQVEPNHSNFDTNLRFTAISSGVEFIVLVVVWLFASDEEFFHLPTIGFAAVFGVCFVGATLFTLLAVAEGSLALSSLLISYSLLIPTAWSIFFNHGDQYKNPLFIIGITLLCVSIFFIREEDKSDKAERKITKKWVFYVVGAIVSNGICNIVRDMHQHYYPEQYRSPFLAISMVYVEIVCLIIMLVRRKERVKYEPKPLVFCSSMNGTVNAIANLLVMTVVGAGVIPEAIMYPVMSAGQFVFLFIIAFIIFKERFSKLQYVGYFLGALSVVILNLKIT